MEAMYCKKVLSTSVEGTACYNILIDLLDFLAIDCGIY